MKVLHIITRLDRGGSTEDVLHSCKYLQSIGCASTIAYGKTINPSVELIEQVKSSNIKFINIPFLIRNINSFYDFLSFVRIYQIVAREKPDIVHTHSSKAGILGRWAAFLGNVKLKIKNEKLIKTVHTAHGHVFYGYYGRTITAIFMMIEKITAIITDKLVALTEGEKNESLAYGIGKPSQWTIIHSGVDIINSKFNPSTSSGLTLSEAERVKIQNAKLRNELNISEDAIVVGSVGRLDSVKGYKYFIEAIKILDTRCQIPDTRFLIIGDGSERKNLESAIFNLKLDDKVIFTGWRNDVEEMIFLMDIYVQPSVNEGMGMTLVQAQALGKPIIATSVQGIPSVVKDGVTGILVPPRNSIALAEAIIRVIRDENYRKKMGEEGKKWVIEIIDNYPRFSMERMIFLLEKLYAELLPT